eukprot:scaffold263480_cov17-Tisochrysis_lutea.AAC.1
MPTPCLTRGWGCGGDIRVHFGRGQGRPCAHSAAYCQVILHNSCACVRPTADTMCMHNFYQTNLVEAVLPQNLHGVIAERVDGFGSHIFWDVCRVDCTCPCSEDWEDRQTFRGRM